MAALRMRGNVLVVCTGNVCRSPYLERVLRDQLGGTGITVTSAGTGALVGRPMDVEARRALAREGIDAEGFIARQLEPDLVASADLVITATRDHRSAVVQLLPRAVRRVFALTDLADLLDGARVRPAPNPVGEVVRAASANRSSVMPRAASDADVIDPYRRGPDVFAQAAQQVHASLPPIVDALRRAST
ncbi:arsenate reductase/protein-tyrosine-phosphatase family protein [Luteipulveratus halotolerans]|nr:low molecular weight phosphatase family protein [Luteipulveratus halotolerans]